MRAIVSGAGGVGSAIAASLAAAGAAELMLFDRAPAAAEALRGRLLAQYPALVVGTGSNDPAGFDLVVNATPLGMRDGDPLPFDVERIDRAAFVGEVVMKSEVTPLLRAAQARGCAIQRGADMPVRDDPGLSRVLRLPERDARRAARRRPDPLLSRVSTATCAAQAQAQAQATVRP